MELAHRALVNEMPAFPPPPIRKTLNHPAFFEGGRGGWKGLSAPPPIGETRGRMPSVCPKPPWPATAAEASSPVTGARSCCNVYCEKWCAGLKIRHLSSTARRSLLSAGVSIVDFLPRVFRKWTTRTSGLHSKPECSIFIFKIFKSLYMGFFEKLSTNKCEKRGGMDSAG